MLVNDKDALRRLNSPSNLINRLRDSSNNSRKSAMSLFIKPLEKKEMLSVPNNGKSAIVGEPHPTENTQSFNPFLTKPVSPSSSSALTLPEPVHEETTLDTILENNEAQIKLGLAHDKALELLGNSVKLLSAKLDNIKADRLPQVVTAASKVVESIRRERNEQSKNNKDRGVHFHFYTPVQKKVSEYEVIDVAGISSGSSVEV